MAAFNTSKFIPTTLTNMDDVVKTVKGRLEADGYTVSTEITSEGHFISLSKGGLFKTISGMKTSLNVTLKKYSGGVMAEAKVGVFGQQALPTLISTFITWPVLITQVIGMIKQSKLDDEVISIIEEAIKSEELSGGSTNSGAFCHSCGTVLPDNSAFCCSCGAKQ